MGKLVREPSLLCNRTCAYVNRDSYHNPRAHDLEELRGEQNPFYNSSRGTKRYDPYTRKYVKWATPNDWYQTGVDGMGIFPHGHGYTRFTTKEARRMNRRLREGRRVDPSRMGSEWNNMGPKVPTPMKSEVFS